MGRRNEKGTSRLVRLTEAVIESAQPLAPAKPGAAPRRAVLLDTQLTGLSRRVARPCHELLLRLR
jgi:hypothetical protein